MTVKQITDNSQKKQICFDILTALPDWFAIPETIKEYAENSADKIFFAAFDEEKPIGFLYLKETGSATAELAVMGVLQEHHRKGIGRKLFEAAKQAAAEKYSFLQVKTVKMGMYPDYDDTNKFYLSLGFKEFEVIPQVWDEANPCQIYVMAL